MFQGSIVALVTPMLDDQVDVSGLRALVEFQIEQGTKAIVAAGSTGESGTLTADEKCLVIKTVVETVRHRVPVIAGTGANATKRCLALTEQAMKLGADAALILTPCEVRPTQTGLYQHYAWIAQNVALPIILYNNPARTGCELSLETITQLSSVSNIVGIKETNASLDRLKALQDACGDNLSIYTGEDASAADWMVAGAKGAISISANVVPRQMADLCEAAAAGDHARCLSIGASLKALHQALFLESNPIPVKWALNRMGLIRDALRLPLTPLTPAHHAHLQTVLQALHCV